MKKLFALFLIAALSGCATPVPEKLPEGNVGRPHHESGSYAPQMDKPEV